MAEPESINELKEGEPSMYYVEGIGYDHVAHVICLFTHDMVLQIRFRPPCFNSKLCRRMGQDYRRRIIFSRSETNAD